MRGIVRRSGRRRRELAAPTASSLTRNPGPAAAAPPPSGTGELGVMTTDDAVDFFVLRIYRVLGPPKFHEFFDVIRRVDSIGERGVMDRLKVLLRGHRDLKSHFNMFLPMQYKLSLRDDVVYQQEEEPAGTKADRPIVID